MAARRMTGRVLHALMAASLVGTVLVVAASVPAGSSRGSDRRPDSGGFRSGVPAGCGLWFGGAVLGDVKRRERWSVQLRRGER